MRPRYPNEIESVRQARRSIGLIRQRLLKPAPEALEACAPHLQNAIESIGWLQHRLGAGEAQPAAWRRNLELEISGFRRELSQVTALMRGASGFYNGLARLLNPAEDLSTGYARNGSVSSRLRPTLRLEA